MHMQYNELHWLQNKLVPSFESDFSDLEWLMDLAVGKIKQGL